MTRRTDARPRLAAAAAVGLIALSVFGGAMLSASAAPGAPSILDPAPEGGVLESPATTFRVDTDSPNQIVEVQLTEDGVPGVSTYCTAATSSPPDSAYCTGGALNPGGYTAEARAALSSDPLGWSAYGTPVHFVVYNDDFPQIVGSPAPNGESDVTPTFIGTGPAMGTVTMASTPANTDCVNVPVDKNGDWGCTWGITPTSVSFTISASGADYAGAAVAGSGTRTFQLQTPYLATITPPAATTNYRQGIQGKKDTNTQRLLIESSIGGGPWTTYCDLDNLSLFDTSWACPAPSGGLAVGTNDLRTTSYNEGGGLTMGGPGSYQQVARSVPGAPTFNPPTPLWRTSEADEPMGGGRDPGVERTVVEIEQGAGNWVSYCLASGLPANNSFWGCAEPDHGLQLGVNNLRVTGYTGDNILTGVGTAQVTLLSPTEVTNPQDGGFVNSPTPQFMGTSGWEGQLAEVRDNAGTTTYCTNEVSGGQWSCQTSALADGPHVFRLYTNYSGRDFTSYPFTVTVDTIAPAAPAISGGGGTTTDRTPTLTGPGEPDAQITVYANGAPVTCVGGAPIVSGASTWSCTLANSLDVDSYSVTSRQADQAGNLSPLSTAVSLTIIGPAVQPIPTQTPTPTPTPTATPLATAPAPSASPTPGATPPPVPLTWKLNGAELGDMHPGDEVVLSADNLPPGLTVDAEFHSTVVKLGSTTVRPNGTFSISVTIPHDAATGLHHFVVSVWTAQGEAVIVEQAVTVVAIAKDRAETTAGHGPLVFGSGTVDRADAGAPSSLTHSINGAEFLLKNPVILCLAAAAALALFLLVAFPAELLNSTLSEQYSRFSRRLPKAGWPRRFTDWLGSMPLVGGVLITVAAAIIFGFVDPDFGFDITSFRVVLACFLALFIVGFLASVISGRILGGRWKLRTAIELKPLGLILTVAGVVISRLLDFSPGFLLGLLLGLSLVGGTTVAQRAMSTLVQASVIFGLSIGAWLLYGALSAVLNPDDFGTSLLFDTLVATTTEGLTGVFIGMLPVTFLDGPSIYAHSKKLWLGAFLVSAFAFVAIIIPGAWGELSGSIVVWVSVVVAFAVIAGGIYLYFRFWAPPIPEQTEDEEQPQLVTERNRA